MTPSEYGAIATMLATCDQPPLIKIEAADHPDALADEDETPPTDTDALAMWDDNGNGRITCAAARGPRHSAGPPRTSGLRVHAGRRRRRGRVRVKARTAESAAPATAGQQMRGFRRRSRGGKCGSLNARSDCRT